MSPAATSEARKPTLPVHLATDPTPTRGLANHGRQAIIWLTLLSTFVTLPSFLDLTLPGGHLDLYEGLLPLATLASRPWSRPGRAYLAVGLVWMTGWSFYGYILGNSTADILRDVRYPAEGILALPIGVYIVQNSLYKPALRTLRPILWVSAAVTLGAAGHLWQLSNGQLREAALFTEAPTDSNRVISPATVLGVATLCAVIGVVVTGRIAFRRTLPYAIPALMLVVLAFSRNHLLALSVAAVTSVLLARSVKSLVRLIRLLLMGLIVLVGLIALVQTLTVAIPALNALSQTADNYEARVITGLSPTQLSIDPSVQYRLNEDRNLLHAFGQRPLLGHGLGYAYQPPTATNGFYATTAPLYAHDFYLWLLAKTGIIGAGLWLWVFLGHTVLGILRRAKERFWSIVPLAGLLSSSIFAPYPEGASSTVAVGLLAGLALVALPSQSRDSSHQMVDMPGSPVVRAEEVEIP